MGRILTYVLSWEENCKYSDMGPTDLYWYLSLYVGQARIPGAGSDGVLVASFRVTEQGPNAEAHYCSSSLQKTNREDRIDRVNCK